jgi:hypothetical protein
MAMKREEISVKKVNLLIKKQMLFVKYVFLHAYKSFMIVNIRDIDVREGFTEVKGKKKKGNRN